MSTQANNVAGAFLNHYFDVKAPKSRMCDVYASDSSLTVAGSGDLTNYNGVDEISTYINALVPSSIIIEHFHAQTTVNDGIVILIKGKEQRGAEAVAFSRTFVLNNVNGQYYIKNDILRFDNTESSPAVVVAAKEAAPKKARAEKKEAPVKSIKVETVAAEKKEDAPAPVVAEKKEAAPKKERAEKKEAAPKKEEVAKEAEKKESAPKKDDVKREELVAKKNGTKAAKPAKPMSWADRVGTVAETETTAASSAVGEVETSKAAKKPFVAANTANQVYVAGVAEGITFADIKQALNCFGTVLRVELVKEKPFAFANFETAEGAAAAIAAGSVDSAKGKLTLKKSLPPKKDAAPVSRKPKSN